jgi:hypothetical protein
MTMEIGFQEWFDRTFPNPQKTLKEIKTDVPDLYDALVRIYQDGRLDSEDPRGYQGPMRGESPPNL